MASNDIHISAVTIELKLNKQNNSNNENDKNASIEWTRGYDAEKIIKHDELIFF